MSEASNRRKRPDDPRWQTVREPLQFMVAVMSDDLCRDALAVLDSLEAENERLREALGVVRECAEYLGSSSWTARRLYLKCDAALGGEE